MSISRRWVADKRNQDAVVALYRDKRCLTCAKIALELNTRQENVRHIVASCIPLAERKALASFRYSASKLGDKNPMYGKNGQAHHNWIGECEDGRGYLTCMWNGQREFVHRVVMMQALGVQQLPSGMEVHHIDSDPKNNSLDNLALVTASGHRRIHFLQEKDSHAISSRKFKLAAALKYMTSP